MWYIPTRCLQGALLRWAASVFDGETRRIRENILFTSWQINHQVHRLEDIRTLFNHLAFVERMAAPGSRVAFSCVIRDPLWWTSSCFPGVSLAFGMMVRYICLDGWILLLLVHGIWWFRDLGDESVASAWVRISDKYKRQSVYLTWKSSQQQSVIPEVIFWLVDHVIWLMFEK